MYNTLIFSQKRETTSFKHLWVDILIFPDFFKLFNSFQLGATSIARICEVWLSDELWGGLRLSSKIPNFSLLEYLALLTQRGFKTALWIQIHDIGTDRSNMSRDHSLLRLATIHYSSINNLFNPNSLRVLPWCITRPLYSKIRAMFESVYAVS